MVSVFADINGKADAFSADRSARKQNVFPVFPAVPELQGLAHAVLFDGQQQFEFALFRFVFRRGALNEFSALVNRIYVLISFL